MNCRTITRLLAVSSALAMTVASQNAHAVRAFAPPTWAGPASPMPRRPPPDWQQVHVDNPQVSMWRNYLSQQRAAQIARLRAYAQAASFPENRVRPGMLNVFIDSNGRLCAVANLLALSGHRALVDQTARANNFIRFADVQGGALMAWALSSGLTREEIVRIQEPYAFIPQDVPPATEWQLQQQERARLQTHFQNVIQELELNTSASIAVELARLDGNLQVAPHDLAMDFAVQPVVQPVQFPVQQVIYQPVQPVQVYYPRQEPVVVYAPPVMRPVRVNPYMNNPVVYQPPQIQPQQVMVMPVQDSIPMQVPVQVQQVQQVQQLQQVQPVQVQLQVHVVANALPM
jgi:hypothetical protein